MNESKTPQSPFLIPAILLISLSLLFSVGASESDICPMDSSDPAAPCPVKCFRPDPVCGLDGITYWCGCADARCAGARVAKTGFCEVGNGSPAQAFLLAHIVWLIFLGIFVLFGLL